MCNPPPAPSQRLLGPSEGLAGLLATLRWVAPWIAVAPILARSFRIVVWPAKRFPVRLFPEFPHVPEVGDDVVNHIRSSHAAFALALSAQRVA